MVPLGQLLSTMNLEDLVNAMTKCDNDGVAMPLFLSSDYSKIPHGNDGNVTMSQLLSIIVDMKAQLSNLEKKSFNDVASEDSGSWTVPPSASFSASFSTRYSATPFRDRALSVPPAYTTSRSDNYNSFSTLVFTFTDPHLAMIKDITTLTLTTR